MQCWRRSRRPTNVQVHCKAFLEILEGKRGSLKIDGEEPTKSSGRLMESHCRIRKIDAGESSFPELEEAGVRLAKMDGKLDLVDARKILKECEMDMEDLSLKVRKNVMDQEMEVEDIPWGILNMRSAQQKEARRWDKAEANLRKALRTTLDFNNRYSTLVAVVNGTEARKPGNITRTPTCRRHWNCRTSSGTSTCCRWRGDMEVVQEEERVAMEI